MPSNQLLADVVVPIPPLIMSLCFQEQIVSWLTAGAVRG
jgi:ABC-type glycerol-3-phosphate transport system permease component